MEFVKFSKNLVTKNVKVEQKLSSEWLIEPFNLFLGISENFVISWKKKRYQLIFSKNHSDLIFFSDLTFLIPKCLENPIFSENVLKSFWGSLYNHLTILFQWNLLFWYITNILYSYLASWQALIRYNLRSFHWNNFVGWF